LGRPPGAPGEPGGGGDMHTGSAHSADNAAAAGGTLRLNVYEIESNPFQPRQDFEPTAIDELCASIKEHGLIQPLVVRKHGGRFQLVAGERRLRAAIKAGWSEVPVQLREADDRQMAELAIVENLQRRDLNALEKAASFQQYLERYGCTQEELAARLNIDRSTVANLIRLLELPELVQTAVRSGAISQGHARALLPLGDEHEQTAFCQRIQSESLSVRSTEELVHEHIRHGDEQPTVLLPSKDRAKPASTARGRSRQLGPLEQELRAALGAKVDLKQTTAGRGKIVIHFASHDEFERLRDYLIGGEAQSQAG